MLAQLLEAAARGIADARVTSISVETRFDAAYRSVVQVGLAALMASGYRTDTSKPGHHQTLIQVLPLTLGVDVSRVRLLDTLRRKRHVIDYSGDLVDDASLAECIAQAVALLGMARVRLQPL
jgi:hypothetical protein